MANGVGITVVTIVKNKDRLYLRNFKIGECSEAMIEKNQRLHKGDILRNDWTGEDNPLHYTMYIKRGKSGSQRTIDCLSYDGRIVDWVEYDNRLVVVGHLKEYDDFIKALSRLKTQTT